MKLLMIFGLSRAYRKNLTTHITSELLFFCLVRPNFEYCFSAWSTKYQEHVDRIE